MTWLCYVKCLSFILVISILYFGLITYLAIYITNKHLSSIFTPFKWGKSTI